MASRTEICNLALSHLGQYRLGDYSENTPTAEAVRDVYVLERDAALRAHHWNFAKKTATLTKLTPAPAFGWSARFELPSDYLRLIECNGILAGTRDTPFTIEASSSHTITGEPIPGEPPVIIVIQPVIGVELLANAETAEIRYIAKITDETKWDVSFVEAFSVLLAQKIAARIANTPEMAAKLEGLKRDSFATAMNSGAVEAQPMVRRAEEGSRYVAEVLYGQPSRYGSY